jgi:hypothetical protein
MKNTKFTKISLLVLALALVIGAMFAMSASAENETKPEITQKNVSYSTDLALQLAVKADTATAPITLYRYDSEPAVGEVGTLVATADADDLEIADSTKNNLAYDSYVIQAPGVKASEAAHYYYYKVVDDNGAESDVIRYSVAEYLYERLATEGISDTQKTLYEATIAYCDAAQVHFESADARISNLNLVIVDGGVVDGYAQGLYATGASVTPTGAGVTQWTVTTYKADGTQTTKYISSTTAITVEGRTEIVSGVVRTYRDKIVDFESGLRYVSAGNAATVEVVSDKVYGKDSNVAKITFTKDGDLGYLTRTNVISATDTTGFEISFDIKFVLDSNNTNSIQSVKVLPDFKNDSNSLVAAYELNIYGMVDGGQFLIMNNKATSEKINLPDVNPTDWNNVCFVVKYTDETKTNTAIYVSVNGSEPVMIDTDINSFNDYTKLERIRIRSNSNFANDSIYIDNMYVGMIKD